MFDNKQKNTFDSTELGKIYEYLSEFFSEEGISSELNELYMLEKEKYFEENISAEFFYEAKDTLDDISANLKLLEENGNNNELKKLFDNINENLKLKDTAPQQIKEYAEQINSLIDNHGKAQIDELNTLLGRKYANRLQRNFEKIKDLTQKLKETEDKKLKLDGKINKVLSGMQKVKLNELEKSKCTSLQNFINHYSTISMYQEVIIRAEVKIRKLNYKIARTYGGFNTKSPELQQEDLNRRETVNKVKSELKGIISDYIQETEKLMRTISRDEKITIKQQNSSPYKKRMFGKVNFNKTIISETYRSLSRTFGKGPVGDQLNKLSCLEKKKFFLETKTAELLWNVKETLDDVSAGLEKADENNRKRVEKNKEINLVNTELQIKLYSKRIKLLMDMYGEVQNGFQSELDKNQTESLQKKVLEVKGLTKKLEKVEGIIANLEKKIQLELKDLEKNGSIELENFIEDYNTWRHNQGVINRAEKVKRILEKQRNKQITQYNNAKFPEKQENVANEIDRIEQFIAKVDGLIRLYKKGMKRYNKIIPGDNGQNLHRETPSREEMDTYRRGNRGKNEDSWGNQSLEKLSEINETPFTDRGVSGGERLSLKVLLKELEPREKKESSSRQIGEGATNRTTAYSLVQKRCQQEFEK